MNSDREYRESLDLPMEDLTIALFGYNGDGEALEDWQIIERAATKINMLKEMILATGMNEALLKACMEN
jgi:hypothetical protein